MYKMSRRIMDLLKENDVQYHFEKGENEDDHDMIIIECSFDSSLDYFILVNDSYIDIWVIGFIDASNFNDEKALFGAVYGNYGGMFFKLLYNEKEKNINLRYMITNNINNPEEVMMEVIYCFEKEAAEFRSRIISHIDGSSGRYDYWRNC